MRMQNAVLTDPARIKEMLGSDFFILFKPKDIVSGDFYFVEKKRRFFHSGRSRLHWTCCSMRTFKYVSDYHVKRYRAEK